MKASVLKLVTICLSSWLFVAVSPAFGATLPELVDSLEGASHNTPDARALSVADAKSDLLTLQDRLDATYAYEKYYESRWHFKLHEVVAR